MNTIPQIGVGTYEMFDRQLLKEVFSKLIDKYTINLDTAQFYKNEALIGEELSPFKDKRSKFWLTTKVNSKNIMEKNTYKSVIESAKKLNTTYLDLVLLHTPDKNVKNNIQAYKDLQKLQNEKIVRHIGVSNFSIQNLKDLYEGVGEYPEYNQIMCSPTARMTDLEEFCHKKGIKLIGYSIIKLYVVKEKYWYQDPMTQDEKDIIDNLANKYKVTFSALMHSWAIQNGYNIIPKSTKIERLIDIYDNIIKISHDDMEKMNVMNKWNDEKYQNVFN